MPLEIEHKYLVKHELWKEVVTDKSIRIKQGYLSTDPKKTVRVRTYGDQGFLTIKGKAKGAVRLEFEYEIPLEEAKEVILGLCEGVIEKTRHLVEFDNFTWEVDVFEGLNAGLIVAEIELEGEDDHYNKPPWLGENVTDQPQYANSNLSIRPFCTWEG